MADDSENDRQAITRARTLDASPAEVWETLTDEILLARWFATEVEFEPREGGDARFEFPDGETREAEIDVVEPGESLGWTWRGEDGSGETGRVEFRLEPADSGRTRLIVIESRPVSVATDAVRWGPALTSLSAMHSSLVCA